MTEERDFDRLARAWLELGPDQAPDRVVAAVLQAVDVTPQVRASNRRRPSWRFPVNRTLSLLAVAAAIAIIAGATIWLNGPGKSVVGPGSTPSPSVTATPTESPSAQATGTAAGPTTSPSAQTTGTPAATAAATATTAALVATGNAVAIAAGTDHTCALTRAGGVKCWGGNTYGQLGNGAKADSNTPVDVSGLTSGVTAIAAGGSNTCAITTKGAVKCWGDNSNGQLGNGSTVASNVPVDVSGLTSGMTAIAVGGYHSCAITSIGAVKCWGGSCGCGGASPLGNGDLQSAVPVDVSGIASGSVVLAAGGDETCALATTGGVKCWGGDNTFGELGDGTVSSSDVPVDVAGLGVGGEAVAVGALSSCALTSPGGVKCWGSNSSGQIGNGTSTLSLVPVDVIGLASGVTAITAGMEHICALVSEGGVMCWGWNNSGQLGNGTSTNSGRPVSVAGIASGAIAVSAGDTHTCAVTSGGGVVCWGNNQHGQLGDGTTVDRDTPVVVAGL